MAKAPIFELYQEYTRKQESPEHFHVWTLLLTIAARIGRNLWIDFGGRQVYPNMYVVVVARSAACRKSGAMDMAIPLLRGSENPPNVIPTKITSSQLIGNLSVHASQGVILSDELTVTISKSAIMDGMLNILTNLYDCKEDFAYETRGRGLEVLKGRSNLSMLGCTTLRGFRDEMPQGAVWLGFTARTVFIFGDAPRHRLALDYLDPSQIIAKEKCILELNRIGQMVGPCAISPEAQEIYEAWYQEIGSRDVDPLIDGYHGRKHTHVLKVALILMAARGGPNEVDDKDLTQAISLLDATEPGMLHILHQLGYTQEGEHIEEVVGIMRRFRVLTRSELLRKFQKFGNARSLDDITETLIASGLLAISGTKPVSYRFIGDEQSP